MKKYLLAIMLVVAPLCAEASIPAWQHVDAFQIREMIVEEATVQGISPQLALAVAEVESDFDPNALSSAGARGVMQVMPETAWGEFRVSANALWDPATNIRVGVTYLRQLLDTYDGRVDIALSHYNGGSAVRQGNRLRVIPATRKYVDKVMALAGASASFSRAGRRLDLEHGDYYIPQHEHVSETYLNGISEYDSDAHLQRTWSGRVVNARDAGRMTAMAYRRARHAYIPERQPVQQAGHWTPVARYEESDTWPSVHALRAARAVEGW